MGPRNLIIALVAGIAIAAGIALAVLRTAGPEKPFVATVLPAAKPVPAFELIDQSGHNVDESVLAGRWDLVFFGFTNCPDICPLTLQTLSQAIRRLADRGQDPLPRIVFVSVDPERDTPDVISRYVAHFGDKAIGLTGRLDELGKLTSGLGIYFAKVPTEGDAYTVDHSAVVLVVDPEGRLRALFSAPHTVETFVDELPRIMATP